MVQELWKVPLGNRVPPPLRFFVRNDEDVVWF
jgi:hypothetical protein